MKKQLCKAIQLALAGGFGLLLANSAATASGFSVPELSALGTATTNAVVANPEETGTFAYNPSAMGFHDGSSLALGTVLINPKFDVTTQSGNHDSQGADWFAAPIFQAALEVHEQWRVGIGVSAPFGLETRWKLGTFPKLSGSLMVPTGAPPPFPPTVSIPTGSHPTNSKLETVALTPTLVYKVNEDLSLAAGLDYYNAREAKLNSQLARVEGNGSAWGWNASLLFRHHDWSLGASFHSAATVDIEGSYRPLDQTLVVLGALPPGQPVNLDVNLPWRLQLGVRYAVNEALAVEFDWTRIGWSEFDKLDVIGVTDGLISSDANNWKDSNAYRFGLTYAIRPTTQLRFGYSYDKTGQGDDYFSVRVPDNDRHLFAIGVGQELGQGWALEAAYMYGSVNERKIRSNAPYMGLGEEINGTDALDGDYNSSVNLVALEVRKIF
jgi:long-chain fatty acid transport protein